ncbi:MAG: hypothetical protein CVV32_11070 [Methanomicrobiales archaeon HGW-Methanomicrobiales-3]|nr:MAG: hypothetical protein CVV32_11070 [Methanomicrobiales archaeon HGW-Methanomicrobiales-3]
MRQKEEKWFCVTCVTMYPFSGISYEKIVQKKDYGNGMQCDASAGRAGTISCPRKNLFTGLLGIFQIPSQTLLRRVSY